MTATDYIPIDTTLRGGPRLEPRSRGGFVLGRKARGEPLDRRAGLSTPELEATRARLPGETADMWFANPRLSAAGRAVTRTGDSAVDQLAARFAERRNGALSARGMLAEPEAMSAAYPRGMAETTVRTRPAAGRRYGHSRVPATAESGAETTLYDVPGRAGYGRGDFAHEFLHTLSRREPFAVSRGYEFDPAVVPKARAAGSLDPETLGRFAYSTRVDENSARLLGAMNEVETTTMKGLDASGRIRVGREPGGVPAARSAGRPSDYPVATGYDRAYQQDSKGGDINDGRHGNFRNFLATDDVPETIFGIPVVQDESGYTEKDVAFFRENPKAAGFYEMGDEDWDGGAEPPGNGGGSPAAAGSGGSAHAADKAGPSEDIESDEEFLVQAQMARARQTEGRGPDETGGLYLDLLATRNGAPAPRVTGHYGVTEIDGKLLDLDQDYTQDQMDAALLELARKAVLKQAPKLVGWGEASLASKFVGADGAYNAGDIHSKMPINEATYARLLSQARADLARAQSRQTAADDLWLKYPDAQLREFLAMEERLAEQEKYDAHARLLQLSDESITNANSVASVNNKGLLTPRRTKTQQIADEIIDPGVNHGIAYSEILDSVKSAAPEATSRFRILSGYTSPGGRPVYVPVGQRATRERLDAAVRNGIIVQTVPGSAVRRPDRGRGVHQDDKGGATSDELSAEVKNVLGTMKDPTDTEVAELRARYNIAKRKGLSIEGIKKEAWALRERRDRALAEEMARATGDPTASPEDFYVPTSREDIRLAFEDKGKLAAKYNLARVYADTVASSVLRDTMYPTNKNLDYLARQYNMVSQDVVAPKSDQPTADETADIQRLQKIADRIPSFWSTLKSGVVQAVKSATDPVYGTPLSVATTRAAVEDALHVPGSVVDAAPNWTMSALRRAYEAYSALGSIPVDVKADSDSARYIQQEIDRIRKTAEGRAYAPYVVYPDKDGWLPSGDPDMSYKFVKGRLSPVIRDNRVARMLGSREAMTDALLHPERYRREFTRLWGEEDHADPEEIRLRYGNTGEPDWDRIQTHIRTLPVRKHVRTGRKELRLTAADRRIANAKREAKDYETGNPEDTRKLRRAMDTFRKNVGKGRHAKSLQWFLSPDPIAYKAGENEAANAVHRVSAPYTGSTRGRGRKPLPKSPTDKKGGR